MRTRLVTIAVWALMSLWSSYCIAQESDGWEGLNLAQEKLPGATLHYESLLHEQVVVFRQYYNQFVAGQAQRKGRLLKKSEDILAAVNEIVGGSPTQAEQANQQEAFKRLLTMGLGWIDTEDELLFYLVTKITTKDYLRRGGSLPGFAYDKAKDTVAYAFSVELSDSADAQRSGIALCVPTILG